MLVKKREHADALGHAAAGQGKARAWSTLPPARQQQQRVHRQVRRGRERQRGERGPAAGGRAQRAQRGGGLQAAAGPTAAGGHRQRVPRVQRCRRGWP